jgi:hypothetical protein
MGVFQMSDTQPKGAIAIGSLPGMRELIKVMTQPKEQLIETIEKALEEGSDGAYEYVETNHREWLRSLLDENKRLKRDKAETMRLVIQRDKEHAIQLQQTREELKQEKKEREGVMNYLSDVNMTASGEPATIFMEMLVGLFEQNGGKNFLTVTIERKDKSARYSITIVNLNGELSASDKLQKQEDEIQSLRTELAAKDKVLEWYADERGYQASWYGPAEVYTKQARTILQQYKGESADAPK